MDWGQCVRCYYQLWCSNSHVKNAEPYSLIGGNPAKLIKKRFTKEQIDKLLEIKWWDWDDSKINKFTPYYVIKILIIL